MADFKGIKFSLCVSSFSLCCRVHEEAGGADEQTGFIATWCNHGASGGPLQLTSFRYLDTSFGRVLGSTPGKTIYLTCIVKYHLEGKNLEVCGFLIPPTKQKQKHFVVNSLL